MTDLDKIGDGDVVWTLRAVGEGSPVRTVSYDRSPFDRSPPEGYEASGLVSLVGLEDDYASRRLRVTASTNKGRAVSSFVMEDLPDDGSPVLLGSDGYRVMDEAGLREALEDSCSPPLIWRVVGIVTIATLVGGGAFWLVPLVRAKRSASPPGMRP